MEAPKAPPIIVTDIENPPENRSLPPDLRERLESLKQKNAARTRDISTGSNKTDEVIKTPAGAPTTPGISLAENRFSLLDNLKALKDRLAATRARNCSTGYNKTEEAIKTPAVVVPCTPIGNRSNTGGIALTSGRPSVRPPASLGPSVRIRRGCDRERAPVLDLNEATPSHTVELSTESQPTVSTAPQVTFDLPGDDTSGAPTFEEPIRSGSIPNTASHNRPSSKSAGKMQHLGGACLPEDRHTSSRDTTGTSGTGSVAEEDEEEDFEELRRKEKEKRERNKIFKAIGRHTECINVNGRNYVKLESIGSGGSCEVFKVMNTDLQLCALKCVKWTGEPDDTVNSYKNEILVLQKLKGKPNIVQLLDHEIKRHAIYLVLELGEIDLFRMLREEKAGLKHALHEAKEEKRAPATATFLPSGIGINYARLFWQQMLEAVNTIHEARVVHKDLKPANFVCFKGRLKLIDFGIANSIVGDTTNIMTAQTLGTINYMSPEQLCPAEATAGGDKFKIGRASDIWSLGCILFQMVYGRPPFYKYKTVFAKLAAIPDPGKKIEYKPIGNPPLLDVMQRCLKRNPRERATIPELLRHEWLR